MREIAKTLLSWFLGCFNFGIYVGDPNSLDSLLSKLQKFGLQEQAYELEQVYLTLIINESLKTLMMFLSLMFLFLANLNTILYWLDKLWLNLKKAYLKTIHFFKTKNKPKHES